MMTEQEMRVAISEACGWFDIRWDLKDNTKLIGTKSFGHIGCEEFEIDNYLNDLDAMHEAEKVLDEKQWEDYFNHISDIVARDWPDDYYGKCIHATSKQRAEAFCRTLFPERFKE